MKKSIWVLKNLNNQTSMKKLRKKYEKIIGKKAYHAWDKEELKKRIKDFEKLSRVKEPVETEPVPEDIKTGSLVEISNGETGVEPVDCGAVADHPTGKDLEPPLEEGLQTGEEVIAEANKPKEPVKEKFTKEVGGLILDKLYHSLRDGRYRRIILDIREKQITKKKVFIEHLDFLAQQVREGELKGLVKDYIINL